MLSGLAPLGIGIALQLQVTSVTSLIYGWYGFEPIATMVVGSVVFLIALLGYCGAIRENKCMLLTYAIFMIVLMIVKVALATVMFVNSDSLTTSVQNEFNLFFQQNLPEFHNIETVLKCCGPGGWRSYGMYFATLPPSCCDAGEPPCMVINTHPGCNDRAADFITTLNTAIGAVYIVVAALELMAVVFSRCLADHVKKWTEDHVTKYQSRTTHTSKGQDPVGAPCL